MTESVYQVTEVIGLSSESWEAARIAVEPAVRSVRDLRVAKSFALYAAQPYTGAFELLEPAEPVDPAAASLFDCAPPATLTPTGSAPVARRAVSGMSTTSCDPATGCC